MNKLFLDRLLRVNHAGEYGAKRIYEGQIAATKDPKLLKQLEEMYHQELKHLAYFDKKITDSRTRPSLLHPLWHIGGFALGYATAKLGKDAAMVCTKAVEEVIESHYEEQISILDDSDDLKNKIKEFQQEEIEHKNLATQQLNSNFMLDILEQTIKFGCKLSIFLAKRI